MKCKCCSSYTPPAYVWALLSVISAILCPFGLYFSNWLEREADMVDGQQHWDSVSSFRVCRNESSRFSTACNSYLSFNQIPSDEWKATTLLMGLGACLLVLVALTALFGLFIPKLFNKVVVILTFSFQLLGGRWRGNVDALVLIENNGTTHTRCFLALGLFPTAVGIESLWLHTKFFFQFNLFNSVAIRLQE